MIEINNEKFLAELAEVFDLPAQKLAEGDIFEQDAPWDSLAVVSTIALADEYFGVVLPGSEISKCKSMKELMTLILSIKNK